VSFSLLRLRLVEKFKINQEIEVDDVEEQKAHSSQ
jgi:hypothetical protein